MPHSPTAQQRTRHSGDQHVMPGNARVLDLQRGAVLDLPRQDGTVILGLSAADVLLCSPEEAVQESEIVLDLCSIKVQKGAYWLITSPYLPTSLNNDVVRGHVTIKQGAIIAVGDRLIRFLLTGDVTGQDQTTDLFDEAHDVSDVTERLRDVMDVPVACSCVFDPMTVLDAMLEESKDGSGSVRSPDGTHLEPRPNHALTANTEVLQFLETTTGLANMTGAIVNQHVSLNGGWALSAEDVDCLFLSFEHVTTWEVTCFQTFLFEYESLFPSDRQVGRQRSETASELCVHAPVIHLLTDLLKLTLDPIEYNILWLRILSALCKDQSTLGPLITFKTAAAVLGCMSATSDVTELQQHGCNLLVTITTYRPSQDEKGPVREGGIQLIVQALQSHMRSLEVVRPALLCLANLLHTYSNLALDTVTAMEQVSLEPHRELLTRVMSILDFMEEVAVPVVSMLPEGYLSDGSIRQSVLTVLSYFHEDVQKLDSSSEDEIENKVGTENSDTENLSANFSGCSRTSPTPSLEEHRSRSATTLITADTLKQHSSKDDAGIPVDLVLSTPLQPASAPNIDSAEETPTCVPIETDKRETLQDDLQNTPPDSPPISAPVHKVKRLPNKRPNIFEKLKRTKPKKSLLSTEYTQNPPPKQSVRLKSSNLLRRSKDRTENLDTRRPTPHHKTEHSELSDHKSTTQSQFRAPPESHPHHKTELGELSVHKSTTQSQSRISPEPATFQPHPDNVSRYVRIFSRMSKKRAHKSGGRGRAESEPGTRSRPNDEEGTEQAEASKKSSSSPGRLAVDFVRRTRRLFREGRGQYDVTQAVRASLAEAEGAESMPLYLEQMGHDLDLSNTENLESDVLY